MKYDVIVIGVGSMGSATCYYLAKQGYQVLGLEQFDIPHELGSHAGQSRIIRKAYGEATEYVPLLQRAYKNWTFLEEETGARIFHETGLLYMGSTSNTFIQTVKQSASIYGIPLEVLSKQKFDQKFPQFNLPESYERLLEPEAGLLYPEKCNDLLVETARHHGAQIKTNTKVQDWSIEGDLITVETESDSYKADKLVVTAGAWVSSLLPQLATNVEVTRQALAWVKPKKWEDFAIGRFPCWVFKQNDLFFYGFPILPQEEFGGPHGLKIGLHHPAQVVTDPDLINREPLESERNQLIQFLNECISSGYESLIEMKTCLYTNTPDEHFIIDFLPQTNRKVAVACGFSGHGFKFASVIGEVLADLVTRGATDLPIEFLSMNRMGLK